jgi:hypothetical protein
MEEHSPGSTGSRLLSYLGSHPALVLLILTPGIPEYLSSSSAINAIVLNPPLFLFQLVANLGLYGPGALLIHDARIRWKKGWFTVLLLGSAYGILEEGIALSTLFDPKAGPVGTLGVYGHWLGVNWVWAGGIVPFHAVFSISIPILLLGLALPSTGNSTFLSRKGTVATLAVLVLDVVILMAIVWHLSGYWMGWPILALSILSIGGLILASKRVPARLLKDPHRFTHASSKRLALVGASFFPAVILTEAFGEGTGVPAFVDFVLIIAVQAIYLVYVTRRDWVGNQRAIIALAFGLLMPIAVFGVLAELELPLTLLLDAAMALFLRRLWIRYGPGAF